MRTVVVGAVVAMLGACGAPPMMHAGNSHAVPAMTPYAHATDLSGYGVGAWTRYRQDSEGYSADTTLRCVGQEGDNLWIEVSLPEYTHLLFVQPDRTVARAYFSGRDDRDWRATEVRTIAPTETGKCPACGVAHKPGTVTWSDDRRSVDGRELACRKAETAGFDCEGLEMKSTSWYSKDVPRLMAMHAPADQGGLVASEFPAGTIALTGFGLDATPKHALPRE